MRDQRSRLPTPTLRRGARHASTTSTRLSRPSAWPTAPITRSGRPAGSQTLHIDVPRRRRADSDSRTASRHPDPSLHVRVVRSRPRRKERCVPRPLGSQPTHEERWGQFTGSPQFRPDLSWLAVADDANGARIAGFALTSLNEEDWDLQGYSAGYVALIGAVREWRGRRLAPALLAHLIPGRRTRTRRARRRHCQSNRDAQSL